MRWVQPGPVIGFLWLVALLGVLEVTVGLDGWGWGVGISCGAAACIVLARHLPAPGAHGMGAANRVTLSRSVLACAVAALTAESHVQAAAVKTLVAMSAVALALDLVDGMVARRTRTTSRFGARFDMEVDAFLIFVLSVYVAHTTAWWVIAIGLARYVFVAARWVFPRLTGSVPPRFWCKVVAAVQGIVLTIAAADVLPVGAMQIALAVALVLLAESFGREAWQLWHAQPGAHDESPHPTGAGMRADG